MKLPITQGIETRYLGPTNSKDGRIKARAWAGSITVAYDHALSIEGNHRAAAMALVAKLGWLDNAPAEAWRPAATLRATVTSTSTLTATCGAAKHERLRRN